jgi:hypothetical protein
VIIMPTNDELDDLNTDGQHATIKASEVDSKNLLTSKTVVFNAICILAPIVGIHAGWLTPHNLEIIAAAFGVAQDQLPIVGAQLICGANVLLRAITKKPVTIRKKKARK